MNGVVVIVAYRPKPGKEKETLELVRNRVPTLHNEGLVTVRAPTIVRARDGTVLEVSEWKSHEAIDAAHENPKVLAMWNKFSLCATAFRSTRSRNPPRCLPVSNRLLIEQL